MIPNLRRGGPPGQRTTFFYLPCSSLDSLAAVFLNMLPECFDGGAPMAPSWSTVPGLRGGHGLGSFNHGPFKHKASGANTAIVHSLEPSAPFSLDPRTKTILCEQEENDVRASNRRAVPRANSDPCGGPSAQGGVILARARRNLLPWNEGRVFGLGERASRVVLSGWELYNNGQRRS